jgi:hypothetical protein
MILGSGDRPELGDPGEDGVGQFLNLGRFVETEDPSMVRPNECAREEKELVAKGETLPVLGQGGTLECDEVIGEADDLPVQVVGRESRRGDISEGKIFAQFADTHFDGGATLVEKVRRPAG